MLLRVFGAFILIILVITKEASASFRVTIEMSTTTSDPRNIMDAPLRPRCKEGERYYKGICRKVFQKIRRETKSDGYATIGNRRRFEGTC
jgi:hypothetical protein